MALPTMPNFWTTRRNIYEQAIVNRRSQEDERREKWSSTANYFQRHRVESAKQAYWSSDKTLQDSMDAYKSSVEKDTKSMKLKIRRAKLADMLYKEKSEYEAELKGLSKDNYFRLHEMKDKVDELKSAREEKRQETAKEKLYQHWRQNNPDIRRLESDRMKDFVIGKWSDQIEETRERLQSAKLEEEAIERQMEEERLAGLERERRQAERKLQDELRLREILKEQMEELKEREREADLFKNQQEALEVHQMEIARLEEERKRKEAARKKQEFGRVLLRQHKAQMLHKSRVIQEELEQDRRLLEALVKKEKEDLALQTARREKAKADAAWMKQIIEEQLRLEKAREAELDMLYQDEAAREWQKREAEWEREKQARERLMNEVLEGRQEQIIDKIEELREQQEESLKRREELIREMEVANQLTRRDIAKQEEEKKRTKLELQEQITARHEREKSARLQEQEDLAEELRAEEQYEQLLREETSRMRQEDFSPRNHGRRQAWM